MTPDRLNDPLEITTTLQHEITKFLGSNSRNEWIYDDFMRVYMRKSIRAYKGRMIKCVDIATVEVDNVNHRRRGLFKSLLRYLNAVNPFDAVLIECVNNKDLLTWCRSNISYTLNDVDNSFLFFKISPSEVMF